MEIAEKTMEMRGMHRAEIADYFSEISIENNEDKKFVGEDWQAEVSEEASVNLGSIKIPVTIVTFSGSREALDKVVNTFRMKFLRAGG